MASRNGSKPLRKPVWIVFMRDHDGEEYVFGPCAKRTARVRVREINKQFDALGVGTDAMAYATELGPLADAYIVARSIRDQIVPESIDESRSYIYRAIE